MKEESKAVCTTPGCPGNAVVNDYCDKCGGPWKQGKESKSDYQTAGQAASDAWLARFDKMGNDAYRYHVSGHFMDGFREGAAWAAQSRNDTRVAELEAKNKDLEWLLWNINQRVDPGTVDSVDAMKQIIREHAACSSQPDSFAEDKLRRVRIWADINKYSVIGKGMDELRAILDDATEPTRQDDNV